MSSCSEDLSHPRLAFPLCLLQLTFVCWESSICPECRSNHLHLPKSHGPWKIFPFVCFFLLTGDHQYRPLRHAFHVPAMWWARLRNDNPLRVMSRLWPKQAEKDRNGPSSSRCMRRRAVNLPWPMLFGIRVVAIEQRRE